MAKRTRIPYPLNIAQLAVREGISADDAWKTYRAVRLNASRDVFDQLYGEAATAKARVKDRMNEPLDSIPEILPQDTWSTRASSGFAQRVQVLQRGPDGEVFSSPYLLRTDQLVTWAEAIQAAVVSYTNNADKYQVTVLGGYATGAFNLVPGE